MLGAAVADDFRIVWTMDASSRPGLSAHAEDEMIGLGNAARPLHAIDQAQERHNVAGAGFRDGVVQAGEGTDVDHERPSGIMSII